MTLQGPSEMTAEGRYFASIILMAVYTRVILLVHYISDSHNSTTNKAYYTNNSIHKGYTPGTHDSTTN